MVVEPTGQFPKDLSPYQYNPRHEEWWNGFDHVGNIHALSDGRLVVTVSHGGPEGGVIQSVNVYRVDGSVLALGLAVPHEGRVIAASGEHVYVARNARLRDDGTLDPLALFEYRLRPAAPGLARDRLWR